MKARRNARSVVLQCLYELDYTNHTFEESFNNRLEEEFLTPSGKVFAHRLGLNIDLKRDELDQITSALAPEWPIDQIACIDRNILRIAIYELLFEDDTPAKVAINEAVELAKEFGSDSAPRFVNGVLGSLAAQHDQKGWLQHHLKTLKPAKITLI